MPEGLHPSGGFMTCRMNGRRASAALRLVPGGELTTAIGRSPGSADRGFQSCLPGFPVASRSENSPLTVTGIAPDSHRLPFSPGFEPGHLSRGDGVGKISRGGKRERFPGRGWPGKGNLTRPAQMASAKTATTDAMRPHEKSEGAGALRPQGSATAPSNPLKTAEQMPAVHHNRRAGHVAPGL